MFRDLKKGSIVYVLDATEKPRYYTAIVQSASAPYIPQMPPSQFNPIAPKVVDIVGNAGGSNEQYQKLPEGSEIATFNNITISCSADALSREVEAMMRNSIEIVNSVDKHREIASECETILTQINPVFAQKKEQDERIGSLEKQLGETNKNISEIKSLLEKTLKSSK